MPKINLSFKNKEMYMYKYLKSKINASYYIKTLVLEDMKKNNISDEEIKTADHIEINKVYKKLKGDNNNE